MEYLSDGWREDIEEAIANVPIWMSGNIYTEGFKAGLKKAIEILENYI